MPTQDFYGAFIACLADTSAALHLLSQHLAQLSIDQHNLVLTTALFIAVSHDRLELSKRISDSLGALETIRHQDTQETFMHAAARADATDCLQWLLEQYPQMASSQDCFGCVPLSYAAESGARQATIQLLKNTPQAASIPDMFDETPLVHAIRHNRLTVIKTLLRFDITLLHRINKYGTTPMDRIDDVTGPITRSEIQKEVMKISRHGSEAYRDV